MLMMDSEQSIGVDLFMLKTRLRLKAFLFSIAVHSVCCVLINDVKIFRNLYTMLRNKSIKMFT